MKTLLKIFKFAVIVVIAGIVLLAFGIIEKILPLTIVGGCLIGAYVVLASVVYIYALFDSLKKKEAKNGGSKKLTEEEMVDEINSTVGISNETAVHTRQAATALNSVRSMSASDKVIVFLLIILILGGIAAVVTLIATGYQIAALCTACGLLVFVFGFFLVLRAVTKSRMKNREVDETQPVIFGKVLSCVNYLEKSFSTGENNAYLSTQKTRIISTVYKLRVSIMLSDDGEEIGKSGSTEKIISVFSSDYYDVGDEVKLARVKGDKKSFIIVK